MVSKTIGHIRNIFLKQQTEIMSIATMLMIIGLVTKVFGLLFNSVAVGYLGPQAYNSFVFASNFPELISQIILLGSISASVLPILAQVLETEGQKRFLSVFNTLVNTSLLIFTGLAAVLALSAPHTLPWFIEHLIRPEVLPTGEEMKQLVEMMQVMLIPQVILGISIYLSTALNLYERFLVPQLAPLFYNLGRILAIYIFLPILGQSPWVLVWGTIFGALVHLLIQIPVIRHIGVIYQPKVDLKDKYILKVAKASGPRVLAISVEQIGITIDKFIAFGLAGTSLALYNLGVLVVSVPLSIIGSSFATATFPGLAKAFGKNERVLAGQIFSKILNQILFFSVIFAVLMLVLRVPIARLTFGIFGNEVGFQETYTIAWVLLFFAPGVVIESLRTFLYRAFYAAHDTVRPFYISIFVLIFGALSGILFTNYLSHFNTFDLTALSFDPSYFLTREGGISAVGGLALSSTLVFTIEGVVILYWLNRKYFKIPWGEYIKPFLKKIIAGLLTLVLAYFVYKIWAGQEMTEKTIYLFALTLITMITSTVFYIGISALLGIAEVRVYIHFLANFPNRNMFKRFAKFKAVPTEPELTVTSS